MAKRWAAPENRITVDEANVDVYGVPRLKIEYQIGDNEHRMAQEMYDTAEQILHSAKAEILPYERGWLDKPGSAIHEHGTCRMGDDPKKSPLNAFNQMHDVKNVFVVDGSAFTTASEKESDAHDFGAGLARHGLFGRRNEARERLAWPSRFA